MRNDKGVRYRQWFAIDNSEDDALRYSLGNVRIPSNTHGNSSNQLSPDNLAIVLLFHLRADDTLTYYEAEH